MRVNYKFVLGVALGLVTSLLAFGVGIWTAAGQTAEDLDKFTFSLLGMLGNWVSGVGALGAIGAALYVSSMQIRDAKAQDAVRCIHHAMAITNDLRSRLQYLQTTLVEGSRPLAALTLNVDAISRRYEALYDRDLYRHLPGTAIGKITSMSGSFFGIEALATSIASVVKNEQHAQLPHGPQADQKMMEVFEQLQKKLDELFTALQAERSKFE